MNMTSLGENNLWRTRTYLVGHMEADPLGNSWRLNITPQLEEMGIIVYNPYNKPFIRNIKEDSITVAQNKRLREEGKFDELSTLAKEIRNFDLNLVDRSDFIIAVINPDLASWGSAEEIFTANRAKKPIFLSVVGGKKRCPIWLFGTFPHKYIYDSPQEIIKVLREIDSGERVCDSSRWRLLRKDIR